MGYDLHITRADDWLDAEKSSISSEEWVAVARTLTALTERDDMGDSSGVPAFLLGDDPVRGPALYWYRGEVTVRGSHEEDAAALFAVAQALGANLIGDDGEHYDADGNGAHPE